MIRSCRQCGNNFNTFMCQIRRGQGIFCSHKCYTDNKHGENNNKWKGGISLKINYCKDCNIKTSDYRYERCRKCANVYFKKGKKVSEEIRKKYVSHIKIRKGQDCNFWKGGVSDLQQLIRNLIENKNWKKEIFKRDNYTCQECFSRGGYLEAHHKKQFAIICAEFLKEYNQFSPIEDKEILARIAQSYSPFWDISNGQTLCEECHKVKGKIKTV